MTLQQKPSQMEKNQDSNFCNSSIQARSSSNVPLKCIKAIEAGKKKQAYMPFLFKNKKQPNQRPLGNPAPGQYLCKSSFGLNTSRDQLKQKYQIQLQNTKKIKQNVVFKSTAKRFNYKEKIDMIPISYSYCYDLNKKSSKTLSTSDYNMQKNKNKSLHKSLVNIQQRLCPSIPDHSNKFGYLLNKQGKLDKINKSNAQLQKQREEMKKYVQTLNQQSKFSLNFSNFNLDQKKQKKMIVQKLRKKIQDISQNSSVINKQKLQKGKKPLHQMSSSCNRAKLIKIFQQKKYLKQNLGPGCYNSSAYSSLNQIFKPQKFQFFSSTSERFSSPYQKANNSHNLLKKMQIQNKLLQAKKQKFLNYRKNLKKPQRDLQRNQFNSKHKTINPGPGDYNPSQNFIKSKLGKVSSFNKSARFVNLKQNKQNIGQKNHKMYTQISDLNSILLQQNQRLPKYTCQVLQKNKQILRNKKQLIQESYKRYITRGQSQYTLCAWDSRPFSRNDVLPSLFKEQSKNQN